MLMNITLQGKNLELTDKIRGFVDDKMDDCFRAFGDMNLDAVQVAIELEHTTRSRLLERDKEQRYRAEVNVSVPGRILRAEASADDVYKAVVEMKHTLTREIRKWRERLRDGQRNGKRKGKAILNGKR